MNYTVDGTSTGVERTRPLALCLLLRRLFCRRYFCQLVNLVLNQYSSKIGLLQYKATV